jgi:hypothetical protein
MARAAIEDWSERQRVAIPHTRPSGSLWHDIQTEAQDRRGAALRAMYADLLLQPLSPQLPKLVREIEMQRGTS